MTGRARRTRGGTTPWGGTAFLIEACLLLAFLVASLAVLATTFAAASEQGRRADELTRAVVLARDAAERFCADPAGELDATSESGLTVTVDVEPTRENDLVRATVVVTNSDDTEVYRLETARHAGGDAR